MSHNFYITDPVLKNVCKYLLTCYHPPSEVFEKNLFPFSKDAMIHVTCWAYLFIGFGKNKFSTTTSLMRRILR